MKELSIEDTAPEFDVKISEGTRVKLSDLKGKYVVLYFYPRDSTPGCTVEARDFNAKLDRFDEFAAIVIGISKDDLTSHEKFSSKHDLKFMLGADIEGKMCENYGVWAQKSMFGKKYMGINRSTFLIDPQGKIAYIWHKVSVASHASSVLKKLEELKSS